MSENQLSKSRELGASTTTSSEFDRRRFLGTLSIMAGAVIAASAAPLAAHAAATDPAQGDARARDADGRVVADSADELWDVDDMWGQRPRYAHPIPYAHGVPGAGDLERSGPYFSVCARAVARTR